MKFIDLFAGLGGFHIGLQRLGHECVFACEIDPLLNGLYEQNFGIHPATDIRQINIQQIPAHDILCAGFPCQSFSKAGRQQGLECPKWGDLFEHVLKILSTKEPKYFILENVPNLLKHNDGKTWKQMYNGLDDIGYSVKTSLMSPHQFGIPQIRERLFIVGCKDEFLQDPFPQKPNDVVLSIESILDANPTDAKSLSVRTIKCLEVWQEFIELFPREQELPSFPIWSMEFGATYPFELSTPASYDVSTLRQFKGSHGRSLQDLSNSDIYAALPSYARSKECTFPKWKVQFIQQNRDLYAINKHWIDNWMPKILEFPPSLQKLEWNCKGENRNLWQLVIQFRASGVRVKRPTTAPSLVAMTTTQVPIISWEKRYMTPKECSRLQSLDELEFLPLASTRAFEALGNAVNADLVQIIGKQLL